MMWPNWRIRESTGQTPFRNIFVYFSAHESAMNLPCIGRSFNKFPIFFQTRRVWKPNTYNEIEHFRVTLLPPCWRAKTIHFLSWEIRSIFMQNCFIVSALQHTEYPIFLTLASPLITSCPIIRASARTRILDSPHGRKGRNVCSVFVLYCFNIGVACLGFPCSRAPIHHLHWLLITAILLTRLDGCAGHSSDFLVSNKLV